MLYAEIFIELFIYDMIWAESISSQRYFICTVNFSLIFDYPFWQKRKGERENAKKDNFVLIY